jgi:site-specific DNA recombinase
VAVCAKGAVTASITVGGVGSRAARKYAITGGLARCGVCDAAMSGAVKTLRNGDRRPYLSCAKTAGGKGCTGVMLDAVEAHVVDRLLVELDRPDFLSAVTTDDHAQRRDELVRALSTVDRDRAELATMWGSGGLTMSEWTTARGAVDARERTLRAELAAIPAPPARVDIGDVRAAWPAMTLDERREILRLFIERIVIHPATPGARAFDPERVAVVWKTA